MNIKRRRLIVIIWIVVLGLLLSSCGAGLTPGSAPTQATTGIATKTPRPAPTATKPAGSLNEVTIESVALTKNLISEKPERTILVYLPPAYDTSTKRYPVVYFLPGFGDRSMDTSSEDINKLIQGGTIQEMIIVVVPGNNRLGGSFYVNSPVTGNWEDFVVKEVVGYVDNHYRTIARVESRGISGHSMGGFGSLNIAILHPDLFGAVYSLSPGLFDENGLANSRMFNLEYSIHKFLDGEKAVLEKPEDQQLESALSMQDYFSTAYGLAFAPDPQKPPFYFDYPYSESNGNLVRDDKVWKQWESGFGGIAAKIPQYKDNFLKLKGIVVDYGTNDGNTWIIDGCIYFDQQLTAAGIPHEMAVHDGDHQSQLGKRVLEHMLPFFSKLLVGE
ncbi:MAG TPA: alpha/beta hydrolase-fold protein [Anaerolineales bacterium]|nr:alpha/beta hydrolase-fold protein [Anaerolineales bacterium]